MTPQMSRFVELGNIIKERTAQINQYLDSQGLPAPSLAVNAAPDLALPPALLKSRNDILEACTELQALTEGPFMHLTRITSPTAGQPKTSCTRKN
jgi:hypothetical protein